MLATIASYSSGGAGGIFAPTLFVGAMLGGTIGQLDVALLHHDPQQLGAFAVVGMGAVFAGVIRAPITSVLIIFEMTGGYGLVLPLMVANSIAFAIARALRPAQIYEALLAQDGVVLPHPGERAPGAPRRDSMVLEGPQSRAAPRSRDDFARATAASACIDALVVDAATSFEDLAAEYERDPNRPFVVRDAEGRPSRVVSPELVAEFVRGDASPGLLVAGALAIEAPTVPADEPLKRVARAMARDAAPYAIVVEGDAVRGALRRADVAVAWLESTAAR
jgi:hypothetical protein